MSNQIIKAHDINKAVWQTLTNSVFPGARDESIMMAVSYCEARGLDVLKKPVHIVPMSVKNAQSGKYDYRDVIMPGIAELRTTASRAGSYCGQSAPDFSDIKQFKIGRATVDAPESCTVTVFKMINGQQVGFSHTEFFVEACATTKDGDLNSMWKKRPRGQLAKCAEAGALRKAFPEDLGGEISFDEAVDLTATDNIIQADESVSKSTVENILKGLSALGESVDDLIKAEGITIINDLTESRAQEILSAKRAKYSLMKSTKKIEQSQVENVPEQSQEMAMDY